MARHLSSCGQPETSASSTGPSFHLLVEARHAKAYWMHVALPVNAPLSKLDKFLRKTWLECCGHLSSFEIAGERYASDPMDGESGMKRPLQQVVDVAVQFRIAAAAGREKRVPLLGTEFPYGFDEYLPSLVEVGIHG